jgi:hypothetical protein
MRIWISLTTSPKRIHTLQTTLNSLLQQTYTPERIVLNIPLRFGRTNEPYEIPKWLVAMIHDHEHILSINRCEKDFGPITKLVPTLELLPPEADVWIATADDDIHYMPRTLELYHQKSLTWKENICMGICGLRLHPNARFSVTLRSGKVDVIEGYGLPIYHRSFFQPSFNTYVDTCLENPVLARSDDIIISNWLALNKIERFQVGEQWCSRERLWGEKRILDFGNESDALHIMENNDTKYKASLQWLEKKELCALRTRTNIRDKNKHS